MPKQKLPVYRKPKKDPGIPDLRIAKQRLSQQVEHHKQLTENRGKTPSLTKSKRKPQHARSLEAFARNVALKQQKYEEKQEDGQDTSNTITRDNKSSKCFFSPSVELTLITISQFSN